MHRFRNIHLVMIICASEQSDRALIMSIIFLSQEYDYHAFYTIYQQKRIILRGM